MISVSGMFSYKQQSNPEMISVSGMFSYKHQSNLEMISVSGMFSYKHQSNPGMSVWDYIDKHHRRSPIFCNFLYSVHDQEMVCTVSNVSR